MLDTVFDLFASGHIPCSQCASALVVETSVRLLTKSNNHKGHFLTAWRVGHLIRDLFIPRKWEMMACRDYQNLHWRGASWANAKVWEGIQRDGQNELVIPHDLHKGITMQGRNVLRLVLREFPLWRDGMGSVSAAPRCRFDPWPGTVG